MGTDKTSTGNLPNFFPKESHILHTLTPIHLPNNTLFPCSSPSTMSARWDLLLNECCFQTLSTIFQSTVYHCWPSCVHCRKSISGMCSPSAPLEAASHQHLHWVSHLVWRSSLAAWLHFTCFLPSFIGHWSHLFMGQGSVFSHFSSLHCNLCLVY